MFTYENLQKLFTEEQLTQIGLDALEYNFKLEQRSIFKNGSYIRHFENLVTAKKMINNIIINDLGGPRNVTKQQQNDFIQAKGQLAENAIKLAENFLNS